MKPNKNKMHTNLSTISSIKLLKEMRDNSL